MLTLKHFKQVCLFIALTLSLIWANLLKADDVQPIAEYRFDELLWQSSTSDQVINSRGNINKATAVNVQPTSEGLICSAANFKNASGYIELKHDLLNDKKEFTLSLWVKTNKTSNQALFAGANGFGSTEAANELTWWQSSSTQFYPNIKGGKFDSISHNSIANDEWQHLVWRRNGDESCLFIGDTAGNRSKQCKTGIFNGANDELSLTTLLIGQELDSFGNNKTNFVQTFDPNQRFIGLMDELLIFDKAITDEQINNIYTHQKSGNNWDGTERTDGICNTKIEPVAEYRFDELFWQRSTSEQVINSRGNVNKATAVGVQPTSEGLICSAANFKNASGYIELKHDLLSNKKEFTLSLWIKTNKTSNQALFSGADGFNSTESANELTWWQSSSTQFYPNIKGGKFDSISHNSIANDEWQHLVWRRNGDQSCLFIGDTAGNRSKQCKTGIFNGANDELSLSTLLIGQELDSYGNNETNFVQTFDPNQRFIGLMDELLIFDKAITDVQINNIYNYQNNGNNWDGTERTDGICNTIIEPIADYRFDEVTWEEGESGKVIDSTKNDNHATAIGVQTTRQNEGKICSAANFDNPDSETDYIEFSNALLDGKEQFTISLWLKSNYPSENQALIWGADTYDANAVRWYYEDAKFRPQVMGNKYTPAFEVNNFADNSWQHFVWRWAGEDSCMFLNGAKLRCESPFQTRERAVSLKNLIVGQKLNSLLEDEDKGRFSSNKRLRGLLDELLIFDKAISDEQIKKIYDNQDAGRLWNEDSSDTERECNYEVDHYRLILDDHKGLTCATKNMLIEACLDEECSATYDGPSMVTMEANLDTNDFTWSDGNPLLFNSSKEFSIGKTSPGKVNYGIEYDVPQAENVFRCFVGDKAVSVGDSGGCYTEFADAGFKISKIDDLIAGSSFTANFEALKKGNTGACENIFEGNQNIKFAYTPNKPANPSTMVNAFTINGTPISNTADTEINVNFDSNNDGKATLEINYLDAGKVSFTASAVLTDTQELLKSTSSQFVVRPASFDIQIIDDPNAAHANDRVFKMAGEAFNLAIKAVNSQGDTTTNFDSEEVTGTFAINDVLQAPALVDGGVKGSMSSSPAEFINGVANINDMSYSEVGIITIEAELPINSYLNHQDLDNEEKITGSISNVGRFIPAQFALTESEVSNGCSTFTYFGQDFLLSYKIVAQNLQGEIVKNYFSHTDVTKNFGKATVKNLIENEDTETENYKSAGELAGSYGENFSTSTWVEGEYSFNTTRAKLLNPDASNTGLSPIAPLTQLRPLVRLEDPDDKKLNALDQNANQFAGVSEEFDSKSLATPGNMPLEMRVGRLDIGNVYGGLSDGQSNTYLEFRLSVEYWDGTKFVINTDDNCSIFEKNRFNMSIVENNPDDLEISGEDLVTASKGIFSGVALEAPDSPKIYRFVYPIRYPWLYFDWNGSGEFDPLEDLPTGEMHFGFSTGNDRIIYRREN